MAKYPKIKTKFRTCVWRRKKIEYDWDRRPFATCLWTRKNPSPPVMYPDIMVVDPRHCARCKVWKGRE